MWSRTYGGAEGEAASSLVAASDGGYAIAGGTRSFGAGSDDFWLVKTDALGNMQWSRTYGGTGYDMAWSLIAASDGGYAIIGDTESFGYLGDVWLVKTDASGNMEWNRTYGGTEEDYTWSLVAASDGGYALTGSTYSFGAGSDDFWLVKTDALGKMQWNRTYGGASSDTACSLVAASDGGYAIAGDTHSFGAGIADFWLVKTDASGNMEWNRTYGGTEEDYAWSLVATSDGGYAIAGDTESFGVGGTNLWLVKTDEFGKMQWNRTYAGAGEARACSLVATFDGGYAIASSQGSFDTESLDFWLVKTDALGNMQWNQTYGGAGNDWAYSLVEAFDGGYAITGIWNYTFPPSLESEDYNGDFWLVKTDEFGVVPEYSSWLIPSLVLAATAFILINKKRLLRTR